MIDYNKQFFFDVESTGFKENYIISIAFIAYENGRKVAQQEYFINPEGIIEASAFEVHGIAQATVDKCPTFDQIWDKISSYVEHAVLLGHNVQYDIKSLCIALKRYGFEIPEFCSICTCKNSKKYVKTLAHHKLNDMCDYFNIVLDNHHDALADVTACRDVYNKLIDISNGELEIVYYDSNGAPISNKKGKK